MLNIDTRDAPTHTTDCGVSVGDVYRINSGERNQRFAAIVAISGETAYELKFNADGIVCGVGQSGINYCQRRIKVGQLSNIPTIKVEWFYV